MDCGTRQALRAFTLGVNSRDRVLFMLYRLYELAYFRQCHARDARPVARWPDPELATRNLLMMHCNCVLCECTMCGVPALQLGNRSAVRFAGFAGATHLVFACACK